MGGNALAALGARRMYITEYKPKVKEVIDCINSLDRNYRPIEIPHYSDKTDFGDADIIVTNWTLESRLSLLKKLNCLVYKVNSDVISLLYKGLQVDIIPVPEHEWFSSVTYYSYNDLGNLMGKIFHKFGLKYGHRGLTLPMRQGTHKFAEILISKDYDKIFDFIGLSYDRFSEGFSDLEEIYEFVIGSKHFNPKMFSLESLNHRSRVRDKKRSTYNGFLKYIAVDEISGPDIVWPEIDPDKSVHLTAIFEHFPEAQTEYIKESLNLGTHQAIKEKINGALVQEWIGYELSGIQLGCFITELKKELGGFGEWVLEKSEEELKGIVKTIYIDWNKEEEK